MIRAGAKLNPNCRRHERVRSAHSQPGRWTFGTAAVRAHFPPARKTEARNGNYSVAHANFVIAYTKDGLAHVIYPGGVTKDDWVHDLPLLLKETWSLW